MYLYRVYFSECTNEDEHSRNEIYLQSKVEIPDFGAEVTAAMRSLADQDFIEYELDPAYPVRTPDDVEINTCWRESVVEAICERTGAKQVVCEYSASLDVRLVNEIQRRFGVDITSKFEFTENEEDLLEN